MVDIRERYPFTFADRQATTRREPLSAGDYGLIVDGLLQATVERKSLPDLVSSLTTGKLKFQLTELAAIPRAAVVVEERYCRSSARPRPAQLVADALAECQVRFPTVPIVFCETRKLAQEWTYRFLAAARVGSTRRWSATSPCAASKRRRRSRPRRRPRPTYVAGRPRTTSSSPPRPDPGGGDGSVPRSPRPRRDLSPAVGCDRRRLGLSRGGLGVP